MAPSKMKTRRQCYSLNIFWNSKGRLQVSILEVSNFYNCPFNKSPFNRLNQFLYHTGMEQLVRQSFIKRAVSTFSPWTDIPRREPPRTTCIFCYIYIEQQEPMSRPRLFCSGDCAPSNPPESPPEEMKKRLKIQWLPLVTVSYQ